MNYSTAPPAPDMAATAGRRSFLKTTASGLLLVSPRVAFGSQANSTIELGLVGCGSRGNWIAPLFTEYGGTRWVGATDVIREHLTTTAAKINVGAGRSYYGPHAYP